MDIDIVSDVICPWCFIGKRRLERALAMAPDLSVRIGWRPFQLNPDMPPDGMDREAYLAAKFGDGRGGRIYDAVIEAGREEGIAFDFDRIRRTPNTVQAHRLIRFAAREGRQDGVVEALFRAYFIDGRDVGSPAVLAAVAGEQGLDADRVRSYLDGDEDLAAVRAEDEYARRIGIGGVPCFILERKYALSGAQQPHVFLSAFEQLRQASAAASSAG